MCVSPAFSRLNVSWLGAAASDGSVGATLLSRAIEHRADLLVMGCYGHSRLSELLFGGATRHILRHMTIPVLMSH